jgi:putative effector of murein hydrolase LrgA (UPF0299 family)
MVIFGQITLIALISLSGSIVSHLLPIALPPSVAGMLILLVLLLVKAIRPHHIDRTAHILLAYMGVLFIPPIVDVADHTELLGSQSFTYVLIIVISTTLTFLATLGSAALVMRFQRMVGKKRTQP